MLVTLGTVRVRVHLIDLQIPSCGDFLSPLQSFVSKNPAKHRGGWVPLKMLGMGEGEKGGNCITGEGSLNTGPEIGPETYSVSC